VEPADVGLVGLGKRAVNVPALVVGGRAFAARRLEQLVNGGKTVFVDFTADWCLTCKANEATAIERPAVDRLIRQNGVVALRADKTKAAPDVDETLRCLDNKAAATPFYAIFPSSSSSKPILLDGLLTSPEPIVNALRQAGPSRPMFASNLKIAPASGNDAGGF
jgi:thiol:disulfide interchange protein